VVSNERRRRRISSATTIAFAQNRQSGEFSTFWLVRPDGIERANQAHHVSLKKYGGRMKSSFFAMTAVVFISSFSFAQVEERVTLEKGQSIIVCESSPWDDDKLTYVNVSRAAANLSARLFAGREVLRAHVGKKEVVISAPYSVSAVSLTSYTKANTPDAACVTVTKQ
jgi:hypothetical protein